MNIMDTYIKFASKIMINSQISYPGYKINRLYGQEIHFLGYGLPGHILIYDPENHFLGNTQAICKVE